MAFNRGARFCEIARQRLLLHPEAYEKFIGQSLDTGMAPGWQLVHLGGVHGLHDVGSQIAMWYIDPVRALADFDNQVVRIVDEWAYNNLPRPRPIQPLVLAARPPSPAKTNAAPQPPKRKRADLFTPVIERAQAQANDPTNHSEVFAILRTWATGDNKPAPIVDYVSGAGVKWRDGSDDMRWLNLEALRKRLNPRPPRSAAKRR